MKGRALRERMSQRRRWSLYASNFKLTRSRFFFISEFTQQDSRKKRTDKLPECDKRDGAITCVFCREFTQHGFFALLQKNLFKGM